MTAVLCLASFALVGALLYLALWRNKAVAGPKATANPAAGLSDEESACRFELGLSSALGGKIDKHFYSHVTGVTFKNEDGTSRQELIAMCEEFQPVYLHVQPEDTKYPDAVYLTADLPGPKLGYLNENAGSQISREILKDDRVWGALVRIVTKAMPGKPAGMVVCLVRFRPEFEEPYRLYPRRALI
jgi:hypothetical protein